MSDLDILVAPGDYPAARQLLLAEGFKQRGRRTEEGVPDTQQAFEDASRGIMLELHCHAVPALLDPSFSAEQVISRARPVLLLGREVFSLDASDLFLILCLHGHKHRWATLRSSSPTSRHLSGRTAWTTGGCVSRMPGRGDASATAESPFSSPGTPLGWRCPRDWLRQLVTTLSHHAWASGCEGGTLGRSALGSPGSGLGRLGA